MLITIKKAAKKINKKLKILGVTVLTGFSIQSLKKTGHIRSLGDNDTSCTSSLNFSVLRRRLNRVVGKIGIRLLHFD